jgi:hypothetical protein
MHRWPHYDAEAAVLVAAAPASSRNTAADRPFLDRADVLLARWRNVRSRHRRMSKTRTLVPSDARAGRTRQEGRKRKKKHAEALHHVTSKLHEVLPERRAIVQDRLA